MTYPGQVLVIDDHFETQEQLQAALATAVPGCQVVAVPSAEEGLLEVPGTPFDLVVTAQRLPGMSGLELIRRLRRTRPQTAVILLLAGSTTEAEAEAASLGVIHCFPKPLDLPAVVAAAQSVLEAAGAAAAAGPEEEAAGEHQPVSRQPAAPADHSQPIQKRLEALRVETDARQVLLVRAGGELRFAAGEKPDAELNKLLPLLAGSVVHNLELADALGEERPLTIQYHAGRRVDLYTANVGRDHFLSIVFDAAARRGRIGTVWIFAQRAVNELRPLLAAAQPGTAVSPGVESGPTGATPPVEPAEAEPVPLDEPDPILDEAILELDWDADVQVDLDAFWEGADDSGTVGTGGLSLEEARQRGLIPPEFGGADELD